MVELDRFGRVQVPDPQPTIVPDGCILHLKGILVPIEVINLEGSGTHWLHSICPEGTGEI